MYVQTEQTSPSSSGNGNESGDPCGYMCNECGNCKSFCPYASAPYKDKFTLFASEADMADSTNDGFAVINPETKECKVRLLGQISDCKADDANDKLYEGLRRLICAVIDDYSYLIMK